MLYVNNSTDLAILGGTIWIDQGGQWTQARLTSLTARQAMAAQKAPFKSRKATTSAPGQNPAQGTRTASTTVTRITISALALESLRTFTATIIPGSNLKQGYVVYTQVSPNS
ncbi:MAG: hypothetical protein Q9198_001497 [Flavoplaca austrocitrina]